MQSDAVVTSVRGEKIRVADVIVHLKLKGVFRSAIYELIEQRVQEQALALLGLTISPAEVERWLRERRVMLGIDHPETFAKYLRFHGIDEEQWRASVRVDAVQEALKQHLATPEKLRETYRRDPSRFASVSVARIGCRSREDAERVLAAVADERCDFVELAREYSNDETTRQCGGYLGNVKRGMLPAEVERQAFDGGDNRIIGPFRENGLWTVYKVYTVNVPKLNDALKSVLRDQIYAEWLREQVCTVPA